MTVQAKIRFRQGITAGNPGEAFFGVLATPVVVENADNLGTENWSFEVVDVPPGSVVGTGVVQDRGTNPTITFNPDVRGGYLVKMTTRDKFGNVAEDIREFGVKLPSGRHIPSFLAIDKMLNYLGQKRGWAKYMEEWLLFLDTLGSGGGFFITGQTLGDLIYFNGTAWVRRGIGATGNTLTVVGGVPNWASVNLAGGADFVTGILPGANVNPSFGAQQVVTTMGVTTPNVDTAGATTLSLGVTNASAVSIGKVSSTTTINGNMIVSGTTTSINSTTSTFTDRLLQLNTAVGPNAPVPTQIAGFNVQRGDVAGVLRDGAGVFWDETSSFLKAAVNIASDDVTLGSYIDFAVRALQFGSGVGSKPLLTSGAGAPVSTPQNGSLHARTDGTAAAATGLYVYLAGAWVRIATTTMALAGSVVGTPDATTVVQIDGSGGNVPVRCKKVTWSHLGEADHGTESEEDEFTTTTATANQTAATFTFPIDSTRCYVLRVSGRDIDAAGFYYGEWRDCFERRTGVSAGIAVRKGAVPTVQGPIALDGLSTASFNMEADGDNVLLRVSPGTTDDIHWTWEIVALRNGLVP